MNADIRTIVAQYGSNRTRLLDILRDVQCRFGHISGEAAGLLGAALDMSVLDILETASFYHFFHTEPSGRFRIYLSNSVVSRMNGYQLVYDALESATGTRFGEPDATGMFGLFETACVGLSDQEPAMLVDDVVFTRLTPDKVADIVAKLKQGALPVDIANPAGVASSNVAYVDAMVDSNIRTVGPVFFTGQTDYHAVLGRCLARTPDEIVVTMSESKLRGRGGAGFSTGSKWRLCAAAPGDEKYIICNADEGEPGTFKDRVLLTRSPKDVFIGMVVAAYAIGARHGIVYLRGEYAYLRDYLNAQLDELRTDGLLGRNIGRTTDFVFDIRIQLGAGS